MQDSRLRPSTWSGCSGIHRCREKRTGDPLRQLDSSSGKYCSTFSDLRRSVIDFPSTQMCKTYPERRIRPEKEFALESLRSERSTGVRNEVHNHFPEGISRMYTQLRVSRNHDHTEVLLMGIFVRPAQALPSCTTWCQKIMYLSLLRRS